MSYHINICSAVVAGGCYDRLIIRGNISGLTKEDIKKKRMFILSYSLLPRKGSAAHVTNAILGLRVAPDGNIMHEVEIPRYAGPNGPSRVAAIQAAIFRGEVNNVVLKAVLYDTVYPAVIADRKEIDITAEF